MRVDELLARLDCVRRSARGWSARCPAHNDPDPSLSIDEGKKGLLLTCFAGCAIDDITAALGVRVQDLFYDQPLRATATTPPRQIQNHVQRKPTRRPAWTPPIGVDERLADWFARRGVPEELAQREGLALREVFMPQVKSTVLCIAFPYYKRGYVVNVKYRSLEGKYFCQEHDCEQVLYRVDHIAHDCAIITEGEVDALSIVAAGIDAVVSVPNGASLSRDAMEALLAPLAGVKQIILAVDNDAPGRTLEANLAGCLGPDRCRRVTWPNEGVPMKDANDVLRAHGAEALRACIDGAQPMAAAVNGNGAAPAGKQEANDATPLLADLIDQIDHTIRHYVVLPSAELGVLIATWIAGTYCFNSFRAYGYLALRSATPRCGKTTLLRLLRALAAGEPDIQSIPTPAVLFRDGKAVLLLDEVDKLRNSDKEKFGQVMAVLNKGFEQGGVEKRCDRVSGKFVVMKYDVYSPKALAGIESIADTLADRSFQIQMQRCATRTPRLSVRSTALFDQLRAGLRTWMDTHCEQIDSTYNTLPDALDCLSSFDDRFQDISEPLLVVASLADAERPDGLGVLPRLLAALRVAAGRREPSSREKQLLAFLDLVEARFTGDADVFIESSTLVELCHEQDDLSHIETARRLAGFLKHFDLFPKALGGKTRGYAISREWVDGWRNRYS